MYYRIVPLIILVLILGGCKQVTTGDSEENNAMPIEDQSNNLDQAIKEVYHRFPSPEEMLAMLEVNDVSYNEQLLNPAQNRKNYIDSRSQALNLGVYAADLAYLTLFEQHAKASEYFEAIYELSDNLRVSSAFDRSLMFRIQENLTNPDSLRVISEEAFISLSNHLGSTDNEKTFALISIGGFIEALYFSFKLGGDYNTEGSFAQKIADQKYVLENIYSYANNFRQEKSVEVSLEKLNELHEIYNHLELAKEETTVSRDKDGKLVIKGGDRLIITAEQYNALKEQTLKARKEITQY